MAYVSISSDLLNRVERKIRFMRDGEITGTCPKIRDAYSKDTTVLFNLGCWREHLHLLDLIPADWLHKQDNVRIHVSGDHYIDGVPYKISKACDFIGASGAFAKPNKNGYWGDASSTLTIDELKALPDHYIGKAELIQRYEDACAEKEIEVRWKKIEEEMRSFLKKCKSLNEAVKLFPGVKLYVDKDDIERLEKKVERKPREALVSNIDTDGISAAAVAARLMGHVA